MLHCIIMVTQEETVKGRHAWKTFRGLSSAAEMVPSCAKEMKSKYAGFVRSPCIARKSRHVISYLLTNLNNCFTTK